MTREEIVAVLCGLRILQREVVNDGEPLATVHGHFHRWRDITPLTAALIGRLCERHNTQPQEKW